jgi:hypothetical protein
VGARMWVGGQGWEATKREARTTGLQV